MNNRFLKGITLIELMIVVVIIGVLAGIAYPSYKKYSVQTRRTDGQIGLTQTANLQEKYFTQCSYYATTIAGTRACAGVGNAASILGAGATSPDGHYNIVLVAGNLSGSCSAAGASFSCGYTLYATPPSGGRQVGDGTFRIDATGVKQWAKNGDSSNYASTASYNYKWTDK